MAGDLGKAIRPTVGVCPREVSVGRLVKQLDRTSLRTFTQQIQFGNTDLQALT